MARKLRLFIDGNNMAFRSAAVVPLTNRNGDSVSVIYGMIQSIRAMVKKFNPFSIHVCWDGGRDPRRVKLLPDYKRRDGKPRTAAPSHTSRQQIYDQIKDSQKLIKALGIPQYLSFNNEGDDVIYYLVKRYSRSNRIIISSDRDFLPLISKTVSVYNPISDRAWNIDNFKDFDGLGLDPNKYMAFRVLVGDKSDNIKGIDGVGKKTALDIIKLYGIDVKKSIEYIGKHPERFNARMRKAIGEQATVDRNYRLMDLRRLAIKGMIKNELNQSPKYNELRFLRRIRSSELGFERIYNNSAIWLMPFRKLMLNRRVVA